MEEYRKQVVLLFSLTFVLIIILFIYKSDAFWHFSKGFPMHTNSGSCLSISENICLSEDAGLKQNYYEASSLCSKRGMSLPTLQDFWEIWTASENCHRAFSSNENVPKSKDAFVNPGENGNLYVPANSIKKYCKEKPIIKFPAASQYKGGMFWLKNSAGDNKHFLINYSSAKMIPSGSYSRYYGVRCIRNMGVR